MHAAVCLVNFFGAFFLFAEFPARTLFVTPDFMADGNANHSEADLKI
jgi:hypothetical protein